MNIKGIFNRKNVPEKESLDSSKGRVEHELDVPKVIFEDLELQVTVGQWLGILSSQKSYGNFGLTIYTHLSAEELMKRLNIPTEKLWEIATKFGLLLKLAGIDNEETCILNKFDKDNLSFNCHFNNSRNDANISLRWGDMIDSGPEFIIDYQNESKTYDYWAESETKVPSLNLQYYTIKNTVNGNSCSRYLSPYNLSFILRNGAYSFSIDIGRPESIKVDVLRNYTFRLKNEEQLQQYLLGLSFPFEINEVYRRICEICEISVNSMIEYPNFALEVRRKLDEKETETTHMLSLKNGQLKKFTVTKSGKTITINGDESWAYDSSALTVSLSDKLAVNYSLNSISRDELPNATTPYEQFNEVSREVEEVKKLAMTILGNNNNSN